MNNIRLANYRDVDEIIAVFKTSILAIDESIYIKQQKEAWAAKGNDLAYWKRQITTQFFVVATVNQKIVGFASVTPQGYIDFMFVNPTYQKQHFASQLFYYIEKLSTQNKVLQLTTYASKIAKPFFAKKGFITISESRTKINEVTLINYFMIKRL